MDYLKLYGFSAISPRKFSQKLLTVCDREIWTHSDLTGEPNVSSQLDLDLDLNAACKPEQAKWFFEGNDIPSREIEDEAAPRREQGAPRLGRHRRRSRDYVRTPAVLSPPP
ncbi:hypothetical protein NL676_007905 [Syzygium grande]|nr:hypothetical protein NL676_007905 [Syzygium grande]